MNKATADRIAELEQALRDCRDWIDPKSESFHKHFKYLSFTRIEQYSKAVHQIVNEVLGESKQCQWNQGP